MKTPLIVTTLLSVSLCFACQKSDSSAEKAEVKPVEAKKDAAKPKTDIKPIAEKGVPGVKPTPLPAPDDVKAAPSDAITSASGLASRVLKAGTGTTKPGAKDTVEVHYTGWTTDGKMFDSSVARGAPAKFPLNRVIKGWTEGVQLMVQGEKRRFWIPGNLAYGDTPKRPGAPAGTLVFDIELLNIDAAPKAPHDVAAAPAEATKTKSGLAYKKLTSGSGTTHPTPTDIVEVHYSGWTKDGNLFDSSVARGRTATFPLNGVIKGWTEGLQLMVEGEKTRFWIPGDLAYGETPGRPGAPAGTLVFDVELVGIRKSQQPQTPPKAAK